MSLAARFTLRCSLRPRNRRQVGGCDRPGWSVCPRRARRRNSIWRIVSSWPRSPRSAGYAPVDAVSAYATSRLSVFVAKRNRHPAGAYMECPMNHAKPLVPDAKRIFARKPRAGPRPRLPDRAHEPQQFQARGMATEGLAITSCTFPPPAWQKWAMRQHRPISAA